MSSRRVDYGAGMVGLARVVGLLAAASVLAGLLQPAGAVPLGRAPAPVATPSATPSRLPRVELP